MKLEELSDLIDFFKDINKYDAKVKELKSLIAVHGKATEIEKLHAKAVFEKKTAEELMTSNREKAEKMVFEAEDLAKKLVDDANLKATGLIEKATRIDTSAIAKEKAAETLNRELKQEQTRLSVAANALQKREAEVSQREQEVNEKKAILAQL